MEAGSATALCASFNSAHTNGLYVPGPRPLRTALKRTLSGVSGDSRPEVARWPCRE